MEMPTIAKQLSQQANNLKATAIAEIRNQVQRVKTLKPEWRLMTDEEWRKFEIPLINAYRPENIWMFEYENEGIRGNGEFVKYGEGFEVLEDAFSLPEIISILAELEIYETVHNINKLTV